MADILLPPWLSIAKLRTDYLDNTGMTRGLYTGAPETTGFGGDRLKLSLEFSPAGTSSTQSAMERAALRSFLARLRGRQNRAYLWDPSYRIRGAFSTLAFELLDSTFATGAVLTASNTNVSTAVHDRVMRATRTAAIADTTLRASGKTTVQYAPYVARVFGRAGRGPMDYRLRLGTSEGATDIATHAADITTQGLQTLTAVTPVTTTHYSILDGAGIPGRMPGDYMDFPYVSFARCALIDNGPNLLLQSDEFDATWTVTRSSIDDQTAGTTAPDGTSTADALIGTSASDTHFVSQSVTVSSTAAEYSFGCALKAGAQTFALLQVSESTSNHNLNCYFNLSTGALGTASVSGANWDNVRAFIIPLGNSWYGCWVVGRKASAATTLTARVYAATSNGNATYAGDGSTADIYAWRATLAQAGVPTRLVQTTTTASSGTNQTGSALYIRGGRAPGEGALLGALLPDDRFEIITSRGSEMKIVTAPLDFDAAGLGYLQFEPPLMGTPADGTPIIIVNPMTRAIFAGDIVGWDDSPGIITTASAEFEEAA